MALDQSVLARGAKRVSFESIPVIDVGALFFGANYDSIVSCLPSCQDADHPPKYGPVRSGDWTTMNLRSTYFAGEAAGYSLRQAPGN